jgi:tetratricopeptide (TPR) repeat protein
MAAPADRQQFLCHRQIRCPLPAATAFRPRLASNFDHSFRLRVAVAVAVIFLAVVVPSANVKAAELTECRDMLIKGDYQACIEATHEAITKNRYGESWPVIKARAEAAIGQFDTSLMTIANGLRRYSWSIRLRWLARESALRSGRAELAELLMTEIRTLVKQFSWRYTDAEELVILGQIDEFDGRDAREILDERFEKAKLRSRTSRDPWLAIGNLALSKSDDSLAADNFKAALEQFPDDPDFTSGLARAIASTDRQAAAVGIEAALKVNPNHIPSILFMVDGMVDAEQYDAAIELLDRVHAIDFLEPEAFAYRAVIAHLTNDLRGEVIFRDKALARWATNPRIDHLIGRKLSQHYRFREGAAYQRKALALKHDFAPAQRQLADDLLRLGEETEGWKVAHAAYDTDSYNVATYNLLELHDELGKFTTLQDDSFTLRMETDESKLYGAEVLALLHKAKQTLGSKYGLELKDRITVEVFPNEDDFAVRTFGMPAVSGYLGVCFGRVITANSPASRRDNPSNWEAVLWHEFCHVITLELTQNKIPRWLSEGISVYEELQANPSWGQRMDPRYREHILNDGLTPLSELSSAFMRPESGWHLQFAYFESCMAVDFLVQNFGMESLRKVLGDLKLGLPVNVALDRRCAALSELEKRFEAFAKKQAESLAPGVDWEPPNLEELLAQGDGALEAWVKEHPKNFVGLMALAQRQLSTKKWADSAQTLKQLISINPTYIGGDNSYERLAGVYQKLERAPDERTVLEQFVAINDDAVSANLRLVELQTAASDWSAVEQTAARLFAIDPLLNQPHLLRATVAEKRDQPAVASRALSRLLLLNPADPADIHFRLAKSLHAQGKMKDAKRQTLMALEEAPRYRDAHQLLLKLVRQSLPEPASN